MRGKIAAGISSFIGALLLGALAAYALSGGAHPSTVGSAAAAPALPLDRAGAINRAVAEAHALGLQGAPSKVTAKRMTQGEYDALTGFEAGPAAAEYGLDPNQAVWVVAIKGRVEWAGPGRASRKCPTCTASDTFDNVTIVLSEATGRKLGSHAAGPGQPMPVSDGEPSVESGAPRPAPQPTAKMIPGGTRP